GLWWLAMKPVADPRNQFAYGVALAPELDARVLEQFQIKEFPYQRTGALGWGGRSYREGLVWAGAVEAVYRVTSEQGRGGLLRQLALSEGPGMARWAVALLSHAEGKEATAAVTRAAENPRLSTSSLLVLDRVLSRLDADGWRESLARER